MVLVGRRLGRTVALALLSHDMDEDRLVVDLRDVLEDRDEVVEVVTVDRPHVIESQLLEEGASGGHAAGVFLCLAGHVLEALGEPADRALAELAHAPIALPETRPAR